MSTIDRQAAIDEMKSRRDAAKEWYDEADDDEIRHRADSAIASFIECILTLKKLPSAQPERKTGHWILDWKHNKATCSECRYTFRDAFDIDNFDNFCRHCGAKMEVDVE